MPSHQSILRLSPPLMSIYQQQLYPAEISPIKTRAKANAVSDFQYLNLA